MARAKTAPVEHTDAILPDDVPQKPLLFATNPFDEDRLDDFTFQSGPRDAFYIPGYSEAKSENETRASKGLPLKPIPRLYFARVTKRGSVGVTESDEGMVDVMRLGYRACGVGDLKEHGYGFPPAAHVGADGLIRVGDTALFIVGAERAKRNRVVQKRLTEEATQRVPASGDRTDSIYDLPEERRSQTGSLAELRNVDLPQTLE